MKLKIKTINANGGTELPVGVEVKFRIVGQFGSDDMLFDVRYFLEEGYTDVTPIIEKDVEIPITDEQDEPTGETETVSQKFTLPRRVRCKKSAQELEDLMNSIEGGTIFEKVQKAYSLIVKEAIENILGDDTVDMV